MPRLAVGRLIKTMAPDPDAERATSTEALRVLLSGLFDRCDAAVKRRDDAAAMGLSRELRCLVAEEAKLNGLYAPERAEVAVRVSSTEDNRRRLLAMVDRDTSTLPVVDAELVKGIEA